MHRTRWSGSLETARSVVALCSALAGGCGHSHSAARPSAPTHQKPVVLGLAPPHHRIGPRTPAQLNGESFPDHVLALTWDDGPDQHTVELARYLHARHVSGTFFVVQSWQQDLSAYPGVGGRKFESGYAHLPVLDQLVELGQRVGNHTLNHVVLPDVAPQLARRELFENQLNIDPFLDGELRLFRVPCGSWSSSVAALTQADPFLSQLVGPVRWDIDAKDWEGSVKCSSADPKRDCEHVQGWFRLKPAVMAKRYLAAIEHAGHGIVLLHDRVADAGSSYAIEVARQLLPNLLDRHYVLTAPVLGFSPLAQRASTSVQAALARLSPTGYFLIDANGDGKADLCLRSDSGIYCLHATESGKSLSGGLPKTSLRGPDLESSGHWLYDVLAPPYGSSANSPLLGDIDGDGRVDACWQNADGVVCSRFPHGPRVSGRKWLAGHDAGRSSGLERSAGALTDVNGDGRADFCASTPSGVECALSTGVAFAKPRTWFSGAIVAPFWGDLNGDGRGDLCFRAHHDIQCAFSTGESFTSASTWTNSGSWSDDDWLGLGDINGDGRADLCAVSGAKVSCGMAP